MRVTYLLDQPDLGGGVKVVYEQARLLGRGGHEVTVAARGARPAWVDPAVRTLDLTQGATLATQDLVVATFWTTVAQAEALSVGPVAHFCQGFEADLAHLAGQAEAIRQAYRRPHPALVVAPHLGLRIREEFGRDFRLAPAPADLSVSRPLRWRPRRRPWIALCGIFEAEVKGIGTGLAALGELQKQGVEARLLRISALPCTDPERTALRAERYLEAVAPEFALRALAACDLLIFPSLAAEGFGLPLLEAMQLGVPAVASRIPGVEFMTGGDGARLVPAGEAPAFAHAARELLGSAKAWREQRRRGLAAARRFDPEAVALEVESALLWAAREAGVPG
jgi:glycosyltransferase involved in cell wall biosynthesis